QAIAIAFRMVLLISSSPVWVQIRRNVVCGRRVWIGARRIARTDRRGIACACSLRGELRGELHLGLSAHEVAHLELSDRVAERAAADRVAGALGDLLFRERDRVDARELLEHAALGRAEL